MRTKRIDKDNKDNRTAGNGESRPALLRRKTMWQMIKENLDTKAKHCCGTYSSFKQGLQYAPEVLDDNLIELEVDTDERDNEIGDFMQMGGKVAIAHNGYQFYLTKKIKDPYGNIVANPSGCIRIGGKVQWKKGRDVRIATVLSIVSPNEILVETLDDAHIVQYVPYTELKAA